MQQLTSLFSFFFWSLNKDSCPFQICKSLFYLIISPLSWSNLSFPQQQPKEGGLTVELLRVFTIKLLRILRFGRFGLCFFCQYTDRWSSKLPGDFSYFLLICVETSQSCSLTFKITCQDCPGAPRQVNNLLTWQQQKDPMKSSHGSTGCRTPHTQESQRSVRVRCVRGELFKRFCLNNLSSLGAPPTGTSLDHFFRTSLHHQ